MKGQHLMMFQLIERTIQKPVKYLIQEDSERLTYRPIVQDDFEQWLPFFKNQDAIKHYLFPSLSLEELCQQWFDRQFLRYTNQTGGFNALINKKTGALVGHCGLLLQTIDGLEELEIGYALLPDFWGMGYASEAAKHCKTLAFEHHWAESLISIITPQNTPSKNVALSNGLKFEKKSTYREFDVDIYRVAKT